MTLDYETVTLVEIFDEQLEVTFYQGARTVASYGALIAAFATVVFAAWNGDVAIVLAVIGGLFVRLALRFDRRLRQLDDPLICGVVAFNHDGKRVSGAYG